MSLLRAFGSLRISSQAILPAIAPQFQPAFRVLASSFRRGFSSPLSFSKAVAPPSAASSQAVTDPAPTLGTIKSLEAWSAMRDQPRLFAIVSVHGQQFKVSPNDVITFNRLKGVEVGDVISLDDVLMVGGVNHTIVGRPLVSKEFVTVKAKVIEHFLGPEVVVFKKKRRKNYKRTKYHEQKMTSLCISDIVVSLP